MSVSPIDFNIVFFESPRSPLSGTQMSGGRGRAVPEGGEATAKEETARAGGRDRSELSTTWVSQSSGTSGQSAVVVSCDRLFPVWACELCDDLRPSKKWQVFLHERFGEQGRDFRRVARCGALHARRRSVGDRTFPGRVHGNRHNRWWWAREHAMRWLCRRGRAGRQRPFPPC